MKYKAKFDFVEFVRPDYYWPSRYTIEQAFGVIRWMAETGAAFQHSERWGRRGPIEALSKKPSCCGFSSVTPIRSIEDLRQRFHYAILSGYGGSGLNDWREKYDIRCGGSQTIAFPHYKPLAGGARWTCEADVKKAIEAMFGDGSRRRTRKSLNRYHPTARTCKGITVAVGARGFRFCMEYGWPDDVSTSSWFHPLAETEGKEPFLDTLDRAITAFDAITINRREK